MLLLHFNLYKHTPVHCKNLRIEFDTNYPVLINLTRYCEPMYNLIYKRIDIYHKKVLLIAT